MNQDKCVVGYCCCGCSLRSGSLAIGIISLVISLITSMYGIYLGTRSDPSGWVIFVLYLIITILCVLLIQGINKERRGYVMAWVWAMAIGLGINTLQVLVVVITHFSLSYLIVNLVNILLSLYFIIVVRSYGLTMGVNPSPA